MLAGGGALIARGDVDRLTRDLDFFTVEPGQVDRLLPVFEAALRAAGFDVAEERVAAGFARLVVSDGGERTGVDLAADARLLPAEASDLGLLLNVEESAVDKVLAIFGRAEARDFVDLAALEPRFGLDHLCELARAKDLGFLRSVFLDMLGRFDRLPRDCPLLLPTASPRSWRVEFRRLERPASRPLRPRRRRLIMALSTTLRRNCLRRAGPPPTM